MSAVADDLADALNVDEDELAPEDQLPESEGGVQSIELPARSDGSPRRSAPILAAMRSLGPCTAREIADHLNREVNNVATQLRDYERRGEVHRTGRAVPPPPGGRGGPQVQWDLGPGTDGQPTSPADVQIAPPAPLMVERDRVRALTARVEELSRQVEAREDERDRARDDARAARDEARSNLDELRRREVRLGELEREVERLQAVARGAAEVPADPGGNSGSISGMRERYFALLLEMAGRDGVEEHVFDRLERLIGAVATSGDEP